MKKQLVIDMSDLDMEGDILDVAKENTGIIYDISKEIEQEISVDYVEDESKRLLKGRKYDICTMFFNLNNLYFNWERERLLRDITKYIKNNGKIYVWDINKKRMQIVRDKINIITSFNSIKQGEIVNNNLFSSCNYDKILEIMKKYFIIKEAKTWQDMFFIEGRMGKRKDESIVDCTELKIYPQ